MRRRAVHLRGLGDALGILIGLRDRHPHAHAAAILDATDRVIDLSAFTMPAHTEDDALNWCVCFALNNDRAAKVVLLSVVADGVREPREDDLRKLATMREAFARYGIEVLDWIRYDGEWGRSLAITSGWRSWDQAGPTFVRP